MMAVADQDLFSRGAVTVAVATVLFGISRAQLYRLMDRGTLPWSRNGRNRLLPRLALEQLLTANLTTAVGRRDLIEDQSHECQET